MRIRARLAAVAVVCVVGAAGCPSPDGPKLHTVRGKVSFESQPVTQGAITFKMGGQSGRAYSAEIKDGEYVAQVEDGSAVVEITASRVVPGKFDTTNGTKEPFQESYIPAKYNRSTKLTADIKPGANDIPFDLKK